MGVLKKLTSEYFGDTMRKEDMLFNTGVLNPVDMGGSVLWADDDAASVGERRRYFSFKEMYEHEFKFGHGWRLPTRKEYRELFRKHVEMDLSEGDLRKGTDPEVSFTNTKNGEAIVFRSLGYMISGGSGLVNFGTAGFFVRWTSEIADLSDTIASAMKNPYKLVYVYNPVKATYTNDFNHWETFFPVRLVKDK
jgi:hypothetical protein